MKPRKLVFDLLQKLEKNNQFSNISLDRALEGSDMSQEDKGLAAILLYGVTERRLTLDYQIKLLSDRPLSSIDPSALCALRIGLYQLIYMDRIPPHAAINESVSLVNRKLSGFVNALLRAYTRGDGIKYPSPDRSFNEYLSVRYSVCPQLCQKFMAAYGRESAESILRGFERIPDTTLSVNTIKTSREELMEKIEGAVPTSLSPRGLRVRGSVRELYGFEEGLFFVQDEASQLCVETLDAREGDTVLDICACPGSKSFGAAISMKNTGVIHSFDLHAKKLPLIVSGAKRLGITIIDTQECDGRKFLPELEEAADRVLCDVPCSGFGVLSKKPELRYKDPKMSEALPDIQLSILENACRYLKEGGILVYSTCTIFPEENEENIKRFLDRHKDFSLLPFKAGELSVPNGYITLLPDAYPTDGFFIAKLTRNFGNKETK